MATTLGNPGSKWTPDMADKLQHAMDSLFAKDPETIRDCEFSFTIADPSIEGCPLVGCSTGFSKLCGYEMEEIVGRNCRFLLDSVPLDQVSEATRNKARAFIAGVADGSKSERNDDVPEWQPPLSRSKGDGIFCAQVNAKRDGTLFNNMFYLKETMLSGKNYIIGLQIELGSPSEGKAPDNDLYTAACRHLDKNMAELERILSKLFWFSSAMRRQHAEEDDGFKPGGDWWDSDSDSDTIDEDRGGIDTQLGI